MAVDGDGSAVGFDGGIDYGVLAQAATAVEVDGAAAEN